MSERRFKEMEMELELLRRREREEKINAQKKKKGGLFSKFIVVLVIVMNIVFTYKILDIFEKVQQEPVAIITGFLAFTTGELWLMASIKKKEVVTEYKEEILDE